MTDSLWSPDDIRNLTGRRALVTGVTSGLGAVVVDHLARAGAEVVMAARSQPKLAAAVSVLRRELPQAVVHPLLIDLTDLSSVRLAADEVAKAGPLHLLVNNAGVMAPPYQRTVDGFELQLATNHLGHFALTALLFPRLVESGNARVVVVSSNAHRMARSAPLEDPRLTDGHYHRWPAYAQSKLANLLFAFELDRRVRAAGQPVRALAAHPGFAATGLMRTGHQLHGPTLGGRILDAAFSALGQSPENGALPLLMAATADLPGGTYVGPGGFGELRGSPRVVGSSRLARDWSAAQRLWRVSEQATGTSFLGLRAS